MKNQNLFNLLIITVYVPLLVVSTAYTSFVLSEGIESFGIITPLAWVSAIAISAAAHSTLYIATVVKKLSVIGLAVIVCGAVTVADIYGVGRYSQQDTSQQLSEINSHYDNAISALREKATSIQPKDRNQWGGKKLSASQESTIASYNKDIARLQLERTQKLNSVQEELSTRQGAMYGVSLILFLINILATLAKNSLQSLPETIEVEAEYIEEPVTQKSRQVRQNQKNLPAHAIEQDAATDPYQVMASALVNHLESASLEERQEACKIMGKAGLKVRPKLAQALGLNINQINDALKKGDTQSPQSTKQNKIGF